ncbi:MAG: hypothetical protein HQK68_05700, partial [Desulfamplus sp.]|nr:hypothetical protein [Desulfamplus sp.]
MKIYLDNCTIQRPLDDKKQSTGYGNYTEEKEKMFEGMSLEDIVAEIKQMREA